MRLGYIRNTIDLDLLVPEETRSRWLDLMRELKYQIYHGTTAFAQFEPSDPAGVPLDLMFVDEQTWKKLRNGATETDLAGQPVLIPRPEFLVALKLHAAASPARAKRDLDWEDIRQVVEICGLDPANESFREIILRYGGEAALARIERFSHEK